MAMTPSTMLPLGTAAPDFRLPQADGTRTVALDDFQGAPALLVVFLCNHCPYVQHLRVPLADLIREYQAQGVAAVGINSNDFEAYPDDRPELMVREQAEFGYTFPYLVDASQEVARSYQAACTPDFFVFDVERKLAYRGQFDAGRPGRPVNNPGADLRAALDAVLAGQPVPPDQKPSLGCNIKWKPTQ